MLFGNHILQDLDLCVGYNFPSLHFCDCVSCLCDYYLLHCVQKKTPTYIFDYNSGVSWSIFIMFIPVEREMNTLQYTYLQSWWRHNCVTLHATKVYFIKLLLNIKYTEFWIEFEDKILIKKLWKCKRFSARRLTKNSVQKKLKRWTLDCFLRKLQTTGSIERTPGSGRPRSSQNVMFITLSSVET